MKRSSPLKAALCAGTAAVLAVSGLASATAAPVLSNNAALKALATDHVTDVRWRGGFGNAVAAGVIAGLALRALSSAPYSYGYGSGYGYAPYGPSPYGYYGYAPYSGAGHFQDQFRNTY
jgi:hypothetical protein